MNGIDYLGGAKYAKVVLEEHPHGWAAGFFSNVFGDALPVVERLLSTGRCPLVRLHLSWRDDHKQTAKDIPGVIKEARRCARIIDRYPNIRWLFSGGCENNWKQAEAIKVRDAVKAIHPRIEYVHSPENPRNTIPGCINEYHGKASRPAAGPFIFSFDSDVGGAEDSNVEAKKAAFGAGEVFFYWSPRCNGRWETNDKTPRPNRKGWPDGKLLDSLIYLRQERGATKLPANWIYKSHSENKGPGKGGKFDPRAEKPVFIVPPKAREIQLRADNGQVVATLRYYGTYHDGRHRYYASAWGFEIADKAKRIQGHPLCGVFVNGKKIGVINPAYRDGSYR